MNPIDKTPLFTLSNSLGSLDAQKKASLSPERVAEKYWIQGDGKLVGKNFFLRAMHWLFRISQSKRLEKAVESFIESTDTAKISVNAIPFDRLERVVQVVLAVEKKVQSKKKGNAQAKKIQTLVDKFSENEKTIYQQVKPADSVPFVSDYKKRTEQKPTQHPSPEPNPTPSQDPNNTNSKDPSRTDKLRDGFNKTVNQVASKIKKDKKDKKEKKEPKPLPQTPPPTSTPAPTSTPPHSSKEGLGHSFAHTPQ